MYFFLSTNADPSVPGKTGEPGTPQTSVDGGSFTATGIATLTEMAFGWYKAAITQATVNIASGLIIARVKTTNAMEQPASFAFEIGGTVDMAAAATMNKKTLTKATGILVTMDQDGSTALATETPTETSTVVTLAVT